MLQEHRNNLIPKYFISLRYILSNQKILLFVSSGRVYTIDPNLLPSGKSNPKNFIFDVPDRDKWNYVLKELGINFDENWGSSGGQA